MMNNYLTIIAEMLNNEKQRKKYAPLLDLKDFLDKDLLDIAKVLIDSENPLEDIYLKHGKELTLKAMKIANDHAQYKYDTTGKAQ